jgi:hypothetical protein
VTVFGCGLIHILLQDFANPEVAPLIQKYPEDMNGKPISEMWQVPNGQCHEIPCDMLMPSLLVGTRRFYIHKVAELSDGRWIIPQIWIEQDGVTFADPLCITRNADVHYFHFTHALRWLT